MQDFKFKDKTIGFFTVTGTVLSSDKRDETTVHSTGGGGRVGQYGGYVAAPQVYSSSITHHDLWLKTEDGQEQCVRLIGSDIPVRPGQKITAVYAGLRQQQADFTGYPTIIFNHDARRHWTLYTGKKLNEQLGISKYKGGVKPVIFWGLALILSINIGEGMGRLFELLMIFGLVSYPIFFIYRNIMRERGVTRMEKELDVHLEAIAQQMHKNLPQTAPTSL